MVSVNLIFHIVSVITFVVLIWYLLHLQSQLGFMRDLMSSLGSSQSKVKVDWPDAFLKRFSSVLGVRFESSGQKLPPQKIDLRLWSDLNRAVELDKIEWSVPHCVLSVRREEGLDLWRQRLEASFQGKITIKWSKASSKGV